MTSSRRLPAPRPRSTTPRDAAQPPERRRARSGPGTGRPRRAAPAVAALAFIALCAAIAWVDTTLPRLGRVVVTVPGLPRTYRLLHVSDLHSARFGDRQARLAGLLGDERYDLAVLTGDLVQDAEDDTGPMTELLEVVKEHAPRTVAVLGNHDRGPAVVLALEAAGVEVLGTGQVADAGDERVPLRVVGRTRFGPLAVPASAAKDVPLLVVASHIPPQPEDLAVLEAAGAPRTLVLSGHTHGGQWRLPVLGAVFSPYGWRTSVIPPDRDGLIPDLRGRFVKGLYERGNVSVHVSPGLGGTFTRLRFLSRAELTEIVLEPER